MDREKEIVEAAASKYIYDADYVRTSEYLAWIDGANWADSHPNDEIISKMIELFYKANIEIRNTNGIIDNLDKCKEQQIEFIKKHWSD